MSSESPVRMRITSAGKVRHYVTFASSTLEASATASVVLVGVAESIAKATSVVEILKRTCTVTFLQTTSLSRTLDTGKPQIEIVLTRTNDQQLQQQEDQ
jgi:hypothetical protein